jgi:hypothetical protein
MPWLPWIALGIAGLSLLVDLLLLGRLERRLVVNADGALAPSDLPVSFRVVRALVPLSVVGSGFSLGSLVGGWSRAPSAVAGLAAAILGMAGAWLLRWLGRAFLVTNGLDGGERREQLVGIATVLVSFVGFQLGPEAADSRRLPGTLVVLALADVGLLAGAAAVVIAGVRRWRRRAFVLRVQAGRVPGYRIVTNGERRALVREGAEIDGYRAGEREVYVFER